MTPSRVRKVCKVSRIADAAVWVPYATERDVDLVSRRVRNYEFNPVWGFLPDQAWLR